MIMNIIYHAWILLGPAIGLLVGYYIGRKYGLSKGADITTDMFRRAIRKAAPESYDNTVEAILTEVEDDFKEDQ